MVFNYDVICFLHPPLSPSPDSPPICPLSLPSSVAVLATPVVSQSDEKRERIIAGENREQKTDSHGSRQPATGHHACAGFFNHNDRPTIPREIFISFLYRFLLFFPFIFIFKSLNIGQEKREGAVRKRGESVCVLTTARAKTTSCVMGSLSRSCMKLPKSEEGANSEIWRNDGEKSRHFTRTGCIREVKGARGGRAGASEVHQPQAADCLPLCSALAPIWRGPKSVCAFIALSGHDQAGGGDGSDSGDYWLAVVNQPQMASTSMPVADWWCVTTPHQLSPVSPRKRSVRLEPKQKKVIVRPGSGGYARFLCGRVRC